MVWFSYIPCEQKENKCVPRFCTDSSPSIIPLSLLVLSFLFSDILMLKLSPLSSCSLGTSYLCSFSHRQIPPWSHLPTMFPSSLSRFTYNVSLFTFSSGCSWCSFSVSPREPELSFASQFPHYFKNWYTGWWYNHVGSNNFYHAPRAGA